MTTRPATNLLKCSDSSNLRGMLHVLDKGYASVMTPVVNRLYRREFVDETLGANQICFTRSPMVLDATTWSYYFVPTITPRLGIDDEESHVNALKKFAQEFLFAIHLKNEGYLSISLVDSEPEALAAAILTYLPDHYAGKILVELPITDPRELSASYYSDEPEDFTGNDNWVLWNRFHAATGYKSNIQPALIMSPNVPPEQEIRRWLGEDIGALIIPHDCFLSNNSNYPVLSKSHKIVLKKFLQYAQCHLAAQPSGGADDHKLKLYSEYFDHLRMISVESNESTDFVDCVRSPLQPLRDDLDSSTYEVFERDPTKYRLYQKAIEAALVDKIPDSEKNTKTLILMVLGAGRGPLIRASLNASKNTGRKLKILVIEKNANAIVTLTTLISVLWPSEDITLISKDMRTVVLEEKADIIVSELLGSFGDNELSPECLDGAQSLLKPDGISIPCDSVSYIRPTMYSKVYGPIREKQLREKLEKCPSEMNWLSYHNSVYYIDEPKELFKFEHPNLSKPIDNSRQKKLTFRAQMDCVLHGFTGYFTSKLYKDIEISILPATHSPGMASWYPMFFPVPLSRGPIRLKANELIRVEFKRKIDSEKVWYEYRTQDSPVANSDGLVSPIHLSPRY